MKKYPYCAEEIQDAAIVCKHCGRELDHPAVVEAVRKLERPDTQIENGKIVASSPYDPDTRGEVSTGRTFIIGIIAATLVIAIILIGLTQLSYIFRFQKSSTPIYRGKWH